MRKHAIRCYPAHTGKKLWVRRAVELLTGLGLVRWLFPAEPFLLGGISAAAFEKWMQDLGKEISDSELYPVFVWPADPGRGRIYAYFLDADGRRRAFCKIGMDDRNNGLIEREAETLNELEAMSLQLSRVPGLIASGKHAGMNYVLVETTPIDARAIDWNEGVDTDSLIDEYAGSIRIVTGSELENLPWWKEILKVFSNRPELINALHKTVENGVEVCRVHGDLNRTNILVDENDIWLLDWERSEQCGPALTDQLCVAVDRLWLESKVDPGGNLQRLKELFPRLKDEKTYGQGVLGLAFLGAAGFTPALSILTEWFPEGMKGIN